MGWADCRDADAGPVRGIGLWLFTGMAGRRECAALVGLDVAPVEPRVVRDRTFLLVERYDRAIHDNGHVRRIHQEDFCQALGVPPETKYASEGGPTFKDCFELLRRIAARPAVDVL